MVNGYDIKRCLECGTLYVERLPGPEELAAIYASDQYYTLSEDSVLRIAEENRRRMKLIRSIQPEGRFLDVGCAAGSLLDQAKQAGYQTFGVEPTAKNAQEANQKGHSVSNLRLDEFIVQCGDDRFDVITCMDVIEHVDNPKEFLALISALLTQEGLIVISTPNYSCIVEKLLGARAPYMTPPEHVTFLTVAGLEHLVQSSRLEVNQFHTFGNLIPAEMERSIRRFLPKALHPFSGVIRPMIRFLFWLMNCMKSGLEQEAYLTKSRKT